MMQSQGCIMSDKEYLVCKLKKSIYGLKQVPRQWYLKFNIFMASSEYTRLQTDHCCYFKYFKNSYIILLLYVDDMLVVGPSMKKIVNLKAQLARDFSMKNLSPAKKMLGMRINKEKKTVEAVTSTVHTEGAEEV